LAGYDPASAADRGVADGALSAEQSHLDVSEERDSAESDGAESDGSGDAATDGTDGAADGADGAVDAAASLDGTVKPTLVCGQPLSSAQPAQAVAYGSSKVGYVAVPGKVWRLDGTPSALFALSSGNVLGLASDDIRHLALVELSASQSALVIKRGGNAAQSQKLPHAAFRVSIFGDDGAIVAPNAVYFVELDVPMAKATKSGFSGAFRDLWRSSAGFHILAPALAAATQVVLYDPRPGGGLTILYYPPGDWGFGATLGAKALLVDSVNKSWTLAAGASDPVASMPAALSPPGVRLAGQQPGATYFTDGTRLLRFNGVKWRQVTTSGAALSAGEVINDIAVHAGSNELLLAVDRGAAAAPRGVVLRCTLSP
jgi:hypothetical protein